jgi:hypothetical protein
MQDVITRWWSTYMATERLGELEEYLNVEEVDMLVSAFLTSEDWEFVYQSNGIMEEFRNYQLFFEGQKYVTISWMPIMLEKLRRHMKQVDGDLCCTAPPGFFTLMLCIMYNV